MPSPKISVTSLKGVPKTLLLPLWGRAELSRLPYSPLKDKKAIELVEALDYDFADFLQKMQHVTYFWMARAFHFDEAIKAYLKKYPDAVIVNLGAGLETAFYRIDNHVLTWVNLDLPEVISLRNQWMPADAREINISQSILDFSWMEQVKQLGQHFLFFAGGLLMYFTEEEVKSILTELAVQFPHAELIFDSISTRSLGHANRAIALSGIPDATLKWGLDDPYQIENWSIPIKRITSFPFFRGIKTLPGLPFKLRLKLFLYDLFDTSRIIHLQFG